MVKPGHPFQRGQFDSLTRIPESTAMDQLSFVQAINGLGQSIVITVALAAHGRLYAGLGKTLAVANADVLGPRSL